MKTQFRRKTYQKNILEIMRFEEDVLPLLSKKYKVEKNNDYIVVNTGKATYNYHTKYQFVYKNGNMKNFRDIKHEDFVKIFLKK